MKVPLLDLQPQNGALRESLLSAIADVCDSQQFILGPAVAALESALAERLGVAAAIGVSSGTDALLAALMALEVGPGDEVITTAYSFFATAGAVVRLGATPVFVDIDPATFNLLPDQVEARITRRTRAIVPAHLFGHAADMRHIVEIAGRSGVPVIEDAAQAIDASLDGRPVGAWGLAGCFSFFPSKNLGGFGDAGLVATSDREFADKVRLIRNHGSQPKYFHRVVGGNFRIDTVQAAVLNVKLPHLREWTDQRCANATNYRALFDEAGLRSTLVLPVEQPGYRHAYNQFIIRAPRRDGLREHLASEGVGTEIYYPVPFHLQPCFGELAYQRGDFPNAEQASSDSLALPIYPGLTLDQQRHVVAAIASFYGKASPSTAAIL